MKKGLITKIIGGIIALMGAGMAIAGIPNWGWIFGFGVVIIFTGTEQE